MSLLVDPHHSSKFLHDLFHQPVRLEFGVGLEIEDQNVLAAEALAPRIHKLARAQEDLDPRLILLFALPFFLGLFFFGFLFGLALLQLLDPFLGLLVFLFLFRVAQRLAVLLHHRGYLFSVQVEESVFRDLALLYFAVALELGLFLRARSRVVFLELVDGLLVVVDLFEQGLQVRQLNLRLFWKIEDALADGSIDRRACHADVVFVTPPLQLDLVWQLHTRDRSVVVIRDLFVHTTDRRCLLHDQVSLRIEENLPLHPGGCGYLCLQRIPSAYLRVPHKRQRDFAFLRIDQPRVVILRRRF